MTRRFVAVLSAPVAVAVAATTRRRPARDLDQSAPRATRSRRRPQVSVSTRLADRREVDAGTRAYSIGFEDGRFYANGWHITGEMGGSGRRP